MLFFLIFLVKSEFVDEFGVEFETDRKENLTSTSSTVVSYIVPKECVVINGGNQVEDSSFRGCNNTIRSLSFEEGSCLSCIYPLVFSNTAIESVNFTHCTQLKSLNNSLFYMCYNLIEVILPPNIISIKEYCFRFCNSIVEIVIPDTLEEIKYQAFSDCYSINNVIISSHSSLKIMGSDVFALTNIISFYFPN